MSPAQSNVGGSQKLLDHMHATEEPPVKWARLEGLPQVEGKKSSVDSERTARWKMRTARLKTSG